MSIDIQDGKARASMVPQRLTDAGGSFSFEHLKLGVYRVYASKEEAGYPNGYFSFYSHNTNPARAVLTTKNPNVDLSLKIGPRAASITGSVIDANTRTPLSATFTLRLIANPDDYISVQQRSPFKILVPPDEGISLEISAQGYKPWHFTPSENLPNAGMLRLQPDQRKTLDIRLQPE